MSVKTISDEKDLTFIETPQSLIDVVNNRFANFSFSQRREITRLVYEIGRRDRKPYQDILKPLSLKRSDFSKTKRALLKKRYPQLSQSSSFQPRLTELNVNSDLKMSSIVSDIAVKDLFVEKDVWDCSIMKRIQRLFPDANVMQIETLKDINTKDQRGVKAYNRRHGRFTLMKERFDFFKKCPCSSGSVSCGYHIVNLGSGCAFECRYCYLQDYLNGPGMILPGNLEDFFDAFKAYKQNIRVGSAEYTDSLIFDHITGYSIPIVKFFSDYPGSQFEFKTKSDNISNLLSVKPSGNIVVSWSVNPQEIVETIEHGTASLERRLLAAKKCADAGYKIAFHFDPVIAIDGWRDLYPETIKRVCHSVPLSSLAWISVGSLRMTMKLRKVIENRFPDSAMLNAEFECDFDGKLRYPAFLRMQIFSLIKKNLDEHAPGVSHYLCMEDKQMCQSVAMVPKFK